MLQQIFKFACSILILASSSTVYAGISNPNLKWNGYLRIEDVYNIHGGIKDGNVLHGSAKLVATYEEVLQLGLIGATHTQRQYPYTGSLQSPSSLDVQREIRLSNLSYTEFFTPTLTGIIGVMDVEDYFDITEAAAYLRNSAFVNAEAWNLNTQIASFPYPGFGALLQLKQDKNYALLGLYQGNPQHLSSVFSHGYMLIGELGTSIPVEYNDIQTCAVKAAGWIYNANSVPGFTNAQGAYVIGQVDWLADDVHALSGFTQLAYSNEAPKYVPFSLTAGVLSNNIFLNCNKDWLTFGIGKIWIHNLPSEVVFELAYVIELYKDIKLTTDMQYFIKPSGIYPNATVFLMRIAYEFYQYRR